MRGSDVGGEPGPAVRLPHVCRRRQAVHPPAAPAHLQREQRPLPPGRAGNERGRRCCRDGPILAGRAGTRAAPAGLEKMSFEFGVPLPEGSTSALPPPKEEIEKLLAIAPRYGIEIKLPH